MYMGPEDRVRNEGRMLQERERERRWMDALCENDSMNKLVVNKSKKKGCSERAINNI